MLSNYIDCAYGLALSSSPTVSKSATSLVPLLLKLKLKIAGVCLRIIWYVVNLSS